MTNRCTCGKPIRLNATACTYCQASKALCDYDTRIVLISHSEHTRISARKHREAVAKAKKRLKLQSLMLPQFRA